MVFQHFLIVVSIKRDFLLQDECWSVVLPILVKERRGFFEIIFSSSQLLKYLLCRGQSLTLWILRKYRLLASGFSSNTWFLHHPVLHVLHFWRFCCLGIYIKGIWPSELFELIDQFFSLSQQQYMKGFFIILAIISLALSLDWTPVDNIIQTTIRNGGFPGATLRIANKTHTIYSQNYGTLMKNMPPFGSPPVTNETIWDIASCSKVTGALGCIMQLVDVGIISIDDLVSKHIPQYGNNGKENTTVKNLLLHNAGLEPDYPGTLPKTKKQVMDYIYNCKLIYAIGTKYVYSDLSFILLGEIAQRKMGAPLSDYVKNNLFRHQIYQTFFLPDPSIWYNIAPTEYSSFRKGLIRGQVHDPTAYLFGGVAGHAGIFSVADDLVKYMQVHLNKGLSKSGKRVYNQSTVQLFYTRVDGLPYNNRRALGWDTVPIQDNPPCGHYFSPNSFGHTGFTGTMMWADRDKQLVIVLLTNRVHPTAFDSAKVIKTRSDVCDATVKILGF